VVIFFNPEVASNFMQEFRRVYGHAQRQP
jgi:hypothetical protein